MLGVLRRNVHFAGTVACLALLPVAVAMDHHSADSGHMVTAYASALPIRLPDGSRATLASGSTIRYGDDFRERRTLWLFGAGRFDIRPGSEFTLWTETGVLKTLGARFDVSAVDRESTFVTVRDGNARLRALNEDNDPAYRSVLIVSGQRGSAARVAGATITPP